jgi:hypothetical protein
MQREGGLSWLTLLIGVGLGIGAALLYAWKIDPKVTTDTFPWQLAADGQQNYIIAVSLAYARDHDLFRARDRLIDLGLGERAWRAVADTACDLAKTNYGSTNTGLTAIRAMVELAQGQGASSCATTLLPLYTNTPGPTPTLITPTPTLIPPATKTLTPTPGPTFTLDTLPAPTATPTLAGDFRFAIAEPLCDPKNPGMLLIFVQDRDGSGLPGVPVQIASNTDQDTFYTGLKPERDPGFADYQMTAGETYTVLLPGISDRSRPLQASECNVAPADGSGKSRTSYRVVFRRTAR